jgi:L-asparaginase / beta-aspartyl-peptidase
MEFSIGLHGGAGVISKDETDPQPFYDALSRIIQRTTQFALDSWALDKTATDIVEFAVTLLEDEELFNAGKGSVFASNETHEMEASIMDGSTLECGAVSLLRSTKNPISAARAVMEYTEHVYLAGIGAEDLAQRHGLAQVDPAYFATDRRRQHLRLAKIQEKCLVDHDTPVGPSTEFPSKTGTVGCVCFYKGHLAAATSTGGMTNKLPGRIGDSPLIGIGNYANDRTCAISATGRGELFIRHVVAYDISARMDYGGCSLEDACRGTIHDKLPAGSGGVVAVDKAGNLCFEWNSGGMFRASATKRLEGTAERALEMTVGIWEESICIS